MPLKRRVWQRRPVTLTPLIDIIFLLLLFFMLSSTFTRFAEVPLMHAAGGAAPSDSTPIFLQLRPDDLSLNGEVMTAEALPAALQSLRAGDAPQTLLVTLDDEVTSQRLVDLLTVLRGLPDLAVSVLE